MSTLTYTCPICHRSGFLDRGLVHHRCPELPRFYSVTGDGHHSYRLRNLPGCLVVAALETAAGRKSPVDLFVLAHGWHADAWAAAGQPDRPFPMTPTPKEIAS